MDLQEFISRIQGFDALSLGEKIDYFVYFLTIIQGKEGIKSGDVENCFSTLKIRKHTNISSYLSANSKKTKTKAPKFISDKGIFHLERTTVNKINEKIGDKPQIKPSDKYFPIELFDETRTYLKKIAIQTASCYDQGLYDACSVMTRKLLEVLIIEAFERYKISDKIKTTGGHFFYLSDLIDSFLAEKSWNVGRNAKNAIPGLKKMGDLSAHNRRYSAKKTDVDKLISDLRIVLEELIHIVDYPSWII